MTSEVAGSPLGTVLSVRHYEAGPPSNLTMEVAEPDNTFATTKEEEWVTKKKTELTTTRQIETRVKRQVVLEDGKVVGDSGPIVTTNTTEDTETQEHKQTEHRTTGDDPPGPDWVAIPGPDGLVKEVKERKVISREEKEERTETEDVQHLGDITDEALQSAIQSKKDIREVLGAQNGELVRSPASPKVVHQSTKCHKVIDTEEKQELSQLQEDGRLVTETRRTTEHEEVRDREEPDEDQDGEEDTTEETRKESSHRFAKTKDQDLVEYIADGVKIGEQMRYVAEDVEGERHGEPHQEWDSLSTRIRRMRRQSKGQTQTPPRPFGPGGAGPLPVDRKDALTKKPLDFDQEEETRKAETSKWLEHHFGSDSRSSKDSMDDEEEAAPVGGSSTSYINVTMKSRPISTSRIVNNGGHAPLQPKAYTATVNTSSRVFVASPEPEGAASGFFQGVSDWAERRTTRVQVLSPTTANNNFLTTERAAYGNYGNGNGRAVSRDSPPNMERASSPYHQRASPYHNGDVENGGEDHHQSPQPPFRRRHHERHEEEREGSTLPRRHKKAAAAEPPPDYSPPTHRATPSPSPPPEAAPTNKKLYQRTRFAADIPPPPARQQRAKSPGQSATSIIGESFRKLVGKFRSSSSERKNKRRSKRSSRSPSPKSSSSTYQQYHVIDGHIPSVPNKASAAARVGRRGGEEEESAAQAQATPVAPPRSSRPGMDHRSYQQRRGASPVVQRFYLGEDPFGGSIYGREREYDGVKAQSRRHHHKQQHNGHRRGSHPGEEDDMNRANVSSSTLGRLSKSTSRLVNGAPDSSLSRGAQTLPRKLYDERVKNQVYIQRTTEGHHWDSSRLNRINKSQPHSNSMINVSIINNVTPPTSSIGVNKPLSNGGLGPAKPARTYRSNLSRSKSFNVHAGSPDAPEASSLLLGSRSRDTSTVYKSNPHLHRLDESPPPLKSPGILASISRSQRDLTASLDKEEDKDDHHRFSKSTSNLIGNGYTSSSSHEAKKKLFMKGLMDRAPELYKTLHGDELPDAKPLSPSPVGRLYSSTPLKNGTTSNLSSSRILDYSSSFRSSSTNNTPENDSLRGRPLSSPYRPPMINGTDRVTSPVGNKSNFTSTLTHTPSFRDTNGTTTSIVRRGSIADDDYSETVRITSKSDDPIRPSVTNTVQSYSKKTVPKKGGHSRETIESSETTTVTKSRYRPESNHYSLRNGGGGGVVIEVRPSRK